MKDEFSYFIHQTLDLAAALDLFEMQLFRFIAEGIFDVLCLLEVQLLLTVFQDQLGVPLRQIDEDGLDHL